MDVVSARSQTGTPATRIAVSTFGALAGSGGLEHGVGELLQGSIAPSSLVIESWPDARAFDVLGGEPAMTVVPNLAVTGVLAIVAGVAVGVWSLWCIRRPRGGLVLIALSTVLLVVGGGFGPPLIGIFAGLAATRIDRQPREAPGPVRGALARMWLPILGAALLGYLSLVPGMVVLSQLTGLEDSNVVLALTAFSFAAQVLAFAAARAHDSVAAWPQVGSIEASHLSTQ